MRLLPGIEAQGNVGGGVYDVIVIGPGGPGCAAAYHLAARGQRVRTMWIRRHRLARRSRLPAAPRAPP